jgi:hypothetical protein
MLTAYQNADYLAVRIRAEARGSKPIRIAFLVDVSDSMNGERLDCVKKTLRAARGLFEEGDRLSMVTFGSAAAVLANNIGVDGLDEFYRSVEALTTAGGTNLSAGIEKLLGLFLSGLDAVVLLTDGHINQGMTSTVALCAMMRGLSGSSGIPVPITALGYGPDHNQHLMRDLGLRSRGSYIFVDSESMMPAAMGDLISGLRTEILKGASLQVPAGLESCEYGSGPGFPGSASHYVGSIVPDRDYWTVFRKRSGITEVTPIVLTGSGSYTETLAWCAVSDCYDLKEQVLRCRVAAAMLAVDKNQIEALVEEIRATPAEFQARPLVLNMIGRLADAVNICSAPPAPAGLARMISGGAYLSVQRGVTSLSDDNTFSSPRQRQSSQQTQAVYDEI